MGFLTRLSLRLGFILALAVTIRIVAGFFSPPHPAKEREMVAWPTGSGGQVMIPRAAIESSSLAAPLDDPLMQAALASLRFHGDGPGAKMTYRSAGGPVTLTSSDVAELNLRYHRLKGDAP